MAKAIMKEEVTAAGIFKGNDFVWEFLSNSAAFFTRLNLAECEANHSLKDLVATIFLIPFPSDRSAGPSPGELLCFGSV